MRLRAMSMLNEHEKEQIRRACHLEKKSICQIAREQEHNRETIKRVTSNDPLKPHHLTHSKPVPVFEPYQEQIGALLHQSTMFPHNMTTVCLTPYSQVTYETKRYSVPVNRPRRNVARDPPILSRSRFRVRYRSLRSSYRKNCKGESLFATNFFTLEHSAKEMYIIQGNTPFRLI